MRYTIDYQYMPKGAARPVDDGEIIAIAATDESGLVLLPAVGDFVEFEAHGGRSGFIGKVKSRAFFYTRLSDDSVSCLINMVVAETDDDSAKLIKS